MPETPWATKLWTTSIWPLRSSSLSGPFHTISTPISREALTAPAWTAFQNSCVVPLGITAILIAPLPPSRLHVTRTNRATNKKTKRMVRPNMGREYNRPGAERGITLGGWKDERHHG